MFDIYDPDQKPDEWGFDPGLVAPEWAWFWENTVGVWPLWSNSTITALDISGNGFNATPVNGPALITTEAGKALELLLASSHYINVGTMNGWAKNWGAGLTINVLMRTSMALIKWLAGGRDSAGNINRIDLRINANSVGAVDAGKIQLIMYDDASTGLIGATTSDTDPLFNDGEIHLITATYNPLVNELGLSVDGVSQDITYDLQGTPSSFSAQTQPLYFGGFNNVGVLLSQTNVDILYMSIHSTVFPTFEIRQLSQDPFGPFRMADEVGALIAPATAGFIPYPNPRYVLTGGMQPMAGGT